MPSDSDISKDCVVQNALDSLTEGKSDAWITKFNRITPSVRSAIMSGNPGQIVKASEAIRSIDSRTGSPTPSPSGSNDDISAHTSPSASRELDAATHAQVSKKIFVRKERPSSRSIPASKSEVNSSVGTALAKELEKSVEALPED